MGCRSRSRSAGRASPRGGASWASWVKQRNHRAVCLAAYDAAMYSYHLSTMLHMLHMLPLKKIYCWQMYTLARFIACVCICVTWNPMMMFECAVALQFRCHGMSFGFCLGLKKESPWRASFHLVV